MPNTLTFEGLEVAPEDEEKLRKYIRNLIKSRVDEGFPIFHTTATKGFNAIVSEEVAELTLYGAQLHMSNLYVGQRNVTDEWMNKIAIKLSIEWNGKEREADCVADYLMDSYKANSHLVTTEILVIYLPDNIKAKPDSNLHKVVKKAKEDRIPLQQLAGKLQAQQGTTLYYIIKEAKQRRIPILNIYPIIHHRYVNSEYPGVRKRKGCQTWYYRIKRKLPNGELITKEKGGFQTDYEAHLARIETLKELTVKEQKEGNNLNLTFEQVFDEFIGELSITKSDALVKKYKSIYNSQLREVCGSQLIAGITNQAIKDYAHNLEYFIFKKGKMQYSQSYVNAIKKLLNLVFDYAYNKGFITTHPMFGLPITWPKPYKG